MPRALILFLFLILGLTSVSAQNDVPVWKLSSSVAGTQVTLIAEVTLPPGYYQDADSDFLRFEPVTGTVTARSSSPTALRAGKASFTGSFTLYRTVSLAGVPPSLSVELGWQICRLDGVCLLPEKGTRQVALGAAGPDLWGLLAAALLGGLLLNLMPCVFPVLALKALAVAGAQPLRRRIEAALFALGGFLAVFVLGLAVAGASVLGQRLDWGFPFQQPVFVWALAALFAVITLQLWGLAGLGSWFSISKPLSAGPVRPLLGGALLVLTAAPCTAPVLGPALGFALTLSPLSVLAVFAAVGAGLALPFLLVALFPGVLPLPRAGRWMTAVERVAGVLMAATVAYLLWILFEQVGPLRLALASAPVVLAVLFVIFRPNRSLLFAGAALGALLLLVPLAEHRRAIPAGWQTFSQAALKDNLDQGRAVLVDATAAWCATCQVNEWAVLYRPDVTRLLDALGVVRLRADYTVPSEEIRSWLAGVQRAGLPVYALYRPGRSAVLFSELLSDENFTKRLPVLLEAP